MHGFFRYVTCRFQGVSNLQHDNGSAFVSKKFQEFCARRNIHSSASTALHPQAQGIVERANRTVLQILRNLIDESQKDWDVYLPTVEATINNTPTSATGHSPFLLMHGYLPLNPAENDMPRPLQDEATGIEVFADIVRKQETAKRITARIMHKYQREMKRRYDDKLYDPALTEGDLVYLYWPRIKQPGTKLKLARIYHGPFIIANFVTASTVILRDPRAGKILTKPVTIHRLKRGHVPRGEEPKWDAMEEHFDDPEELDEGDLPTGSFLTEQEWLVRERAKERRRAERLERDKNEQGLTDERVNRINEIWDKYAEPETPVAPEEGEAREVLLEDPTPVVGEDVVPKATKNPVGPDVTYHKIKDVLKYLVNTDGEKRFQVEFEDGDVRYLTIDCLNQAARDIYLDEEYETKAILVPRFLRSHQTPWQ